MNENVFHYECGCSKNNIMTFGITDKVVEFPKGEVCKRCGKEKIHVLTTEKTFENAVVSGKNVLILKSEKVLNVTKAVE